MKGKDFVDGGDLLSTILKDELFIGNDEMIVDECITFFFAGSQTVTTTVTNLVIYMIMH